MPLDYYDPRILHVQGSWVAKVLKVDKNTEERTKGRFAQICVELNFDEPLHPLILLNRVELKVQYEGIHFICFSCGWYGLDKDKCPHVVGTGKEVSGSPGGGDGRSGKGSTEIQQLEHMGVLGEKPTVVTNENNSCMVVQ